MKKYKILSILAIVIIFIPGLFMYLTLSAENVMDNNYVSMIEWMTNIAYLISFVIGITCTITFFKNIKDIKLYWLIPAIFSIILNLGFIYVGI